MVLLVISIPLRWFWLKFPKAFGFFFISNFLVSLDVCLSHRHLCVQPPFIRLLPNIRAHITLGMRKSICGQRFDIIFKYFGVISHFVLLNFLFYIVFPIKNTIICRLNILHKTICLLLSSCNCFFPHEFLSCFFQSSIKLFNNIIFIFDQNAKLFVFLCQFPVDLKQFQCFHFKILYLVCEVIYFGLFIFSIDHCIIFFDNLSTIFLNSVDFRFDDL